MDRPGDPHASVCASSNLGRRSTSTRTAVSSSAPARCAPAEVNAGVEGERAGRAAVDVEAARIGVHVGVTVGGHDPQQHRETGRQIDALPRARHRIDPRDPRCRRIQADALLGGPPAQRRIGAHLVELVGMHEQAPHRAVEPEIRRVGAGRKQQQEEGVDLVVGQPLTVDLRGGNAVPSTAGPPLRSRCW